jgi:hypothetical protein
MTGHEPRPDRLIADIARELRQSMPIDQALNARVLAEINRNATERKPVLAWIGLAVAAGIALLAFVVSRDGTTGGNEGVAFSLEAPQATRVSLVGDFNNWDPAATPLARGSAGRWEAIVPLTPGRYQFTFVVDGSRWVRDPSLPQALGDDFGQPTSVITVLHRSRS